jgi:hypothetical protein
MENRERDRVSKRNTGTEAGDINRETSAKVGREQNSGTSAEFGQGIGRSEYLSEGGEMESKRDRNQSEDLRNKSVGSESTRRSGSEGYGSSSGRSGSTDRSESIDKSSNRDSSGSMESSNLGKKSFQDEH